MALAFLCQRAVNRLHFRIGDHRPGMFRPFLIDHGIRQESHIEAQSVLQELSRMGFQTQTAYWCLRWRSLLTAHGVGHPSKLPGLESLARRQRYRTLAKACVSYNITSLLVAHHEDDQYETVLMRLLGGHGTRGLRGIQPAVEIPESDDIHRAHRSGFHDDQSSSKQLYILVPTPRERGAIRGHFRDLDPEADETEMRHPTDQEWPIVKDMLAQTSFAPWTRQIPMLSPLDIEDGGITLYRPLLAFSKERLIATCLANKVSWVEDRTNQDPGIATRNAVRHLWKNHQLPRALQKPAILALAQRCQVRVEAEEAEAGRLLERIVVSNFQPNVGTVVAQFPEYGINMLSPKDRRDPLRRKLRLKRRRAIAALAIRRLFSLVDPSHGSELAMLQSFVHAFFPGLPSDEAGRKQLKQPTPIAIAGVHCIPMIGKSSPKPRQHHAANMAWYLTRAPFPANKKPSIPISPAKHALWVRHCRNSRFYLPFVSFDGRFWIAVVHRLPTMVMVRPFAPEYSKQFRESLSAEDRKNLDAILKTYAPGKVRFTLPGIFAIAGTKSYHGQSRRAVGEWNAILERILGNKRNQTEEGSETAAPAGALPDSPPCPEVVLLALPTLGVQVEGLEKVMYCEVRYKNFDLTLLKNDGRIGAEWVLHDVKGKIKWRRTIMKQAMQWQRRKKSHIREERRSQGELEEDVDAVGPSTMYEGWWEEDEKSQIE